MSATPEDSATADFWSTRYASGRTPWQLDDLPERLRAFLRSLPPARNVLIPGCGQDHRTIAEFCRAGHRVTAIDFSPVAVSAIRQALPDSDVILGEFFRHEFRAAPFDIIYERTFLCSLPPSLWNDYAGRVAELLRPHGTLAGFFFYGREPDPPPYPLSDTKANELFVGRFVLRKSEPVSDSVPMFAGQERWQEWERTATTRTT